MSKEQNLENKEKALHIADIMAMFPTKEEIENKASSYNNSMSSMNEAIWMPQGFKEGVEWTVKMFKNKLEDSL